MLRYVPQKVLIILEYLTEFVNTLAAAPAVITSSEEPVSCFSKRAFPWRFPSREERKQVEGQGPSNPTLPIEINMIHMHPSKICRPGSGHVEKLSTKGLRESPFT